jgi:hypothetical protein
MSLKYSRENPMKSMFRPTAIGGCRCGRRHRHRPRRRAAVSKVADLPIGHGLNAATLKYGDLAADGVIDPVNAH